MYGLESLRAVPLGLLLLRESAILTVVAEQARFDGLIQALLVSTRTTVHVLRTAILTVVKHYVFLLLQVLKVRILMQQGIRVSRVRDVLVGG